MLQANSPVSWILSHVKVHSTIFDHVMQNVGDSSQYTMYVLKLR